MNFAKMIQMMLSREGGKVPNSGGDELKWRVLDFECGNQLNEF